MRLKHILQQFDEIAGEYTMCLVALGRLREELRKDPTMAGRLNINIAGIRKTVVRLESTYLIRSFALFEAALRDLWANAFLRKTEPPARVLIDALAGALKFMPPNLTDRAHEVREFRNAIVHLNVAVPATYTFAQATHHLKAYLSHMPREW